MNTFTKLTSLTFALTLWLFFGTLFLSPMPAEAQVNVVVNGGSGTNAERQIVTINNQMLNFIRELWRKEYQLDPAANNIKTQNAANYYQVTKQYVAAGDNGSPFFIDNVEIYRAGIRANTANDAIQSLSGSGMCDAFENEVIVELKRNYIEENAQTVAQKQSCTLDTVTENGTEQFTEGRFGSKGVQALWTIMNDPSQSPRGAELEAERLVREQVDEAEENALLQANWGQGFKDRYNAQQNVIVCTQGEVNGIRNNCRIATPSALVRDRAANLLNIETELKMSGDEHQETESAMIDAVIRPTLAGGITGRAAPINTNITPPVLGGGGGGGGGGTTPFPNIPNNPQNPATQAFLVQVTTSLNQSSSSTNPVRPVLLRTLTKLQYQLETVELIDDTEDLHASTSDKYEQYNCYTVTFPSNFGNERTLTLTEIPFTIDAVKVLYDLFLKYQQAVASNTSTTQIVAQLQTVEQTNFAIPTQVDLNDIAAKYNNVLSNQVGSFMQQHNQRVAACELIINPPSNNNSNGNNNNSGNNT